MSVNSWVRKYSKIVSVIQIHLDDKYTFWLMNTLPWHRLKSFLVPSGPNKFIPVDVNIAQYIFIKLNVTGTIA